MAPQFNQPALKAVLKQNNILYAHFDKEFGARRTDPAVLDELGQVYFAKLRATAAFKQGLKRLKKGLAQGYQLALMCSEGDPFDCHRFALISYQLAKEGWRVKHILPDSQLAENSDLEAHLLPKYRKKIPPQSSFFETVTRETQLELAYQLRNKDIGFETAKAEATAATGRPSQDRENA